MDRYIDRLCYDVIVKIIRKENPHLSHGQAMGDHCLHHGHCKSVCVLAKKRANLAEVWRSIILQAGHRLLLTSSFVRACIWVRARVYLCAIMYFLAMIIEIKNKDSTQHLNFFHLLGLYADKTE